MVFYVRDHPEVGKIAEAQGWSEYSMLELALDFMREHYDQDVYEGFLACMRLKAEEEKEEAS